MEAPDFTISNIEFTRQQLSDDEQFQTFSQLETNLSPLIASFIPEMPGIYTFNSPYFKEGKEHSILVRKKIKNRLTLISSSYEKTTLGEIKVILEIGWEGDANRIGKRAIVVLKEVDGDIEINLEQLGSLLK